MGRVKGGGINSVGWPAEGQAFRVPGELFASPSGYQLACSSRSTAAIVRHIVQRSARSVP